MARNLPAVGTCSENYESLLKSLKGSYNIRMSTSMVKFEIIQQLITEERLVTSWQLFELENKAYYHWKE